MVPFIAIVLVIIVDGRVDDAEDMPFMTFDPEAPVDDGVELAPAPLSLIIVVELELGAVLLGAVSDAAAQGISTL